MENTGQETPTPRYEFAPEQDVVMRRAGARTRVWGYVTLAGGVILAALAVVDLVSTDRAGATALIYALLAVIPIVVGYYFVRSGSELVAVATTRGSDILHLMRSLDSLSRAFLVQIAAAVVWVVLVALAALTVPRLAGGQAAAYQAAQKADLLNLALLQERYHDRAGGESGAYTDNLPALGFRASEGVSVTVAAAGPDGWAAVSSHTATPDEGCAIYVGAVEPPETPGGRTPAEEHQPICD